MGGTINIPRFEMPTLTSYFNDMGEKRWKTMPRVTRSVIKRTISLLCAFISAVSRAVPLELLGQMAENFLCDRIASSGIFALP